LLIAKTLFSSFTKVYLSPREISALLRPFPLFPVTLSRQRSATILHVCLSAFANVLAFEMSDDEWQDDYDDEEYFWIEEPDPTVAVSLFARCSAG
jgi:hypothetical protein